MNEDKEICSNESLPEGLVRFCEAYDKNHPGHVSATNHNLYLLQTVDRDGNITGEAYGMNLMTDTGFTAAYKSGINVDNEKIFIGDGTDTPVVTNNALYSPILTTGSTKVSYSTLAYGMLYDASTGIISQRKKMYEGYFDYDISSLTEEKTITEIGYGLAYNNLQTHTLIYDEDGNPSSIVKRLNEKLTIVMYWTICFKKDLIVNAYDKGIYMAFYPTYFLLRENGAFTPRIFYLPNNCNDYTRYGDGSSTVFSDTTTVIDNVATSQFTIGSRFIDGVRQYISNIVLFGSNASYWNEYCRTYNSYFFLLTKVKMANPEEIVCEEVYTNNYSSTYMTEIFGNYTSSPQNSVLGKIPAVDFDMQSLSMYNHITKEWDITENFVNNPDADYNTNFMGYVRIWTYITFLKTSKDVYVFINLRNDIPITSFSNTGITVYATDEYWNTDSYEIISNLSAIDGSLQTKRYYVTFDYLDSDFLYPTRQQKRHQIITKNASIDEETGVVTDERKRIKISISTNNYSANLCNPLSNDEYGYIVYSHYIIYPDSVDDSGNPYVYTIGDKYGNCPHGLLRWQFTKGDKFACLSWNGYYNTLRVYTLSNDPSIKPVYEDITIFTQNSNKTYWSSSQNGFVVGYKPSDDKSVFVDLYGGDDNNTVVQYELEDSIMCAAIDLTNYCVYLSRDTSVLKFVIFDMKEQTIIDSFTLPNNGYTVNGIRGWNDYIYIRVTLSNTSTTFLYYIETQNLVHLPNLDIPALENDYLGHNHQYCVDECMIVCGMYNNGDNKYDVKVFTTQDPENPINLFSNISTGSFTGSYDRQYICSGQLKYMNDGKQLIFGITGYYRTYVVDVGHVIDTGESISYLPFYHYFYNDYYNNTKRASIALYKCGCYLNEYYSSDRSYSYFTFDPMETYLPHKIVGTTYTIQSYNNPKRVGSRTYSFSVSNDTSKWDLTTTE